VSEQRQQLGQRGEQEAERFLRQRGLRVLARRYRTTAGELDLVAADGVTIVFVEVKTQTTRGAADPEEKVRRDKRNRMVRAARAFVRQKRLDERPCRFDIVAVVCPTDGPPEVRHFEDVFQPRDW
jgi:putative endonuclease